MFRGLQKDHITVLTGNGGGDCGYVFYPDREYLVIADAGPNGMFFTSICSGTNSVEDSGAALRLLAGEKPTLEDLLSPEEYQKLFAEKILPSRTGSVCGTVLRPDGKPLQGASVNLWEPRSDDLPSNEFSDPNTASDTGHFCIEHADPGRYLLTVEQNDFDHDVRYMAFYPGVSSRDKAVLVEIKAGVKLPDVTLATIREPVFRIRIRVRTPDGGHLSYNNGCFVVVQSEYRDPLSYRIDGFIEDDGSRTFGYIPAGKYFVDTYFVPVLVDGEEKMSPEASKWKPVHQEVVVSGDTDVVIRLEPK